jgi:hypothetical protein
MIEPTLYYETINRNAILVKAKKPFYDWINYVDPEFPIINNDEGTVYLVKEMQTKDKIERWLKRNYDQIFRNEMNDYHTNENDWPQKRTFKVFNEWFSVEISSMIVDLSDKPVEKL